MSLLEICDTDNEFVDPNSLPRLNGTLKRRVAKVPRKRNRNKHREEKSDYSDDEEKKLPPKRNSDGDSIDWESETNKQSALSECNATVPIEFDVHASLRYERKEAKMVRTACLNSRNRENLAFMEWSEAVLLQLCHMEKRIDFTNLSWREALGLLVDQWLPRIIRPIRVYVGCHIVLRDILIANRHFKISSGVLSETDPRCFVTSPSVNYRVLNGFKSSLLVDEDDGLKYSFNDRPCLRKRFKCNKDIFRTI